MGLGGVGLSFISKHFFLRNRRLQVNISILDNSGLWYMDILSYFLYFSVF